MTGRIKKPENQSLNPCTQSNIHQKFETGVQYKLLCVTAVGYWPPLQSAVKHCNYNISLYVGSLLLLQQYSLNAGCI
jgi:hypothetical protein